MRNNLSIQPELFEGMEEQACTLVRELLESRLDPVFIVNEAIIPAVEASATGLKSGSFQVTRLPELGKSLQAVMKEIEDSLGNAGLSLHFRLGRARDDVFDLWGAEIADAFEAAGFRTLRSSELNRCEVVAVCNSAWVSSERKATPGHGNGKDCLTGSKISASREFADLSATDCGFPGGDRRANLAGS